MGVLSFTSFCRDQAKHSHRQFSCRVDAFTSFCLAHDDTTSVQVYTVRAPVFGRHQFFGTWEHYGKAHGSLLSGWMNYNYTACCWFPTSSNILILPSQFWQIRFESCWLHCSKCRILVLLRYKIKLHTVFPFAFCGKKIQHHSFLPYACHLVFFFMTV